MPLLTLCTNHPVDDPTDLAREASKLVSNLLGKSESYVMVKILPVDTLLFATSDKPAAHLELKSLGLKASETASLAKVLCEFMESRLAIPGNRVYIEFSSPQRTMWGWDGRTFA